MINPTFLDGVTARLAPLFPVPLEGGMPIVPRSTRVNLLGGGDLDFFRDPDDLVAPITCETVKLDESDFITASAIRKELAVNSDPSLA